MPFQHPDHLSKNKTASQRKALPLASALVALSVVSPNVLAQTLAPIVISATVELNFGTFTAGAGGGTVVISQGGGRNVTGSVTAITGAGLETPASLSLSASTGESVVISMDAAAYNAVNETGAIMAINNFDINGSGVTATVVVTTNPLSVPVGATINVNAAQPEGVYKGSYVVNANY